jgi:DNA-binding protein HU-beta
MTKQEFVDIVARRSGLSRREAGAAVDAVIDTITDALKRRDSVNFTGFGKFATSDRKARMGVNPRNPSQKGHIQAATVPKFTAGSGLKQAVRGHTGGSRL